MFLEKTEVGSIDVIKLPNRMTMAGAAAQRHALRDLVDSGRNRLVIDMGNVEFVDSSGLSVLVSAVKAARASGGDVVLLDLSGPVRSLIELTRLHYVFEIFTDMRAASTHFDSPVAA